MENKKDYSNLSKENLIKLLSNRDCEIEIIKEEKTKINNTWKNKYELLEADFKALQIKNNEQLKEIEILKEKNILARVRQFSKKTEQIIEDYNEFNEAESEIEKEKKVRGRKVGSTNFDSSYLESHVNNEIIIEPDQTICPECGSILIPSGEDISYKVDYQSAKLIVTKYISKKLSCKKCSNIFQKSKEDNFPHSICTPSLASAVMSNKFLVGIPYYRQSAYFFNEGIKLSRQNLCNYQLRATKLLEPLYDRLKTHLLETKSKCLCADETTIRVLSENDRYKSYMRVYVSSYYDLPIYYYEYKKDRSKKNPVAFLENFKGFLLTDAYQGYSNLNDVVNCYCWAHARRKYFDIVKSLKKEQLPQSKAYKMINLIDVILLKEREMREHKCTPSQIKNERDSKFYKINLDNIKNFAESIDASPESALGQATNYLISRWDGFVAFLQDGHIELTNNISERAVKPFVIARKNFLFSNTSDGAQSSAIFFSLQQTARANLLDSEKYITKVLELIKPNMSNKELDVLLPWNLAKLYNLS